MGKSKRLQLLSPTEVSELYAIPIFNAHEQELYFTLSKPELVVLDNHTNTKTRVYFILQLGYFKAKQQFFNFSFDDVSEDALFIFNTYHNATESGHLSGGISRDYARKQRQAILTLYGYRNWSSDYEQSIKSHIGELLRYHPKGHSAFRQLLTHFDQQKIVIPSYSTLQDMFSNGFSTEEKRLNAIIMDIPTFEKEQL